MGIGISRSSDMGAQLYKRPEGAVGSPPPKNPGVEETPHPKDTVVLSPGAQRRGTIGGHPNEPTDPLGPGMGVPLPPHTTAISDNGGWVPGVPPPIAIHGKKPPRGGTVAPPPAGTQPQSHQDAIAHYSKNPDGTYTAHYNGKSYHTKPGSGDIFDDQGNKVGTAKDGKVYDLNGNLVATADENGNIHGAKGPSENHKDAIASYAKQPNGTVTVNFQGKQYHAGPRDDGIYDSSGKKVATFKDGVIYDLDGKPVASYDDKGNVFGMTNGAGKPDPQAHWAKTPVQDRSTVDPFTINYNGQTYTAGPDGIIKDKNGNPVAKAHPNLTIADLDGKVIATYDADGNIYWANPDGSPSPASNHKDAIASYAVQGDGTALINYQGQQFTGKGDGIYDSGGNKIATFKDGVITGNDGKPIATYDDQGHIYPV